MQPDEPMMQDPAMMQDGAGPLALDAYPVPGLGGTPCYGVACVEGIPDGSTPRRMFAPDALDFAPTPFSFKWQMAEDEGHRGSMVAGRVDAMWRDGALLRWVGCMDSMGKVGAEAERLIAGKFVTGVSVKADDIDNVEVEYVYGPPPGGAEVEIDEDDAEFHLPGKHNQKDHGNSRGPKNTAGPAPKGWRPNPKYYPKGLPGQGGSADGQAFADAPGAGMADMAEPTMMIIHKARVRSLTLLPEPAFVECTVSLGVSPFQPPVIAETVPMLMEPVDAVQPQAVVAAAYTITIPDIWPESWFKEPATLPPFGAIHITPQGRVYGLLGPARVNHRAFRNAGQRVQIPRGIDYSEFMNKPALVASGDGHVYRIPAGNITFDCGHASPFDSRREDPTWAASHYDNTCSVAARICVGENKHGTWVAGALMHDITPDAVERMMACALSGDWQGGKLNAALLVPVEGFPTAVRASVRVRDDAIVASSVPVQYEYPEPDAVEMSDEDLDYVFDLIASANGRNPMGLFDELTAVRFNEIAGR